MACHGLILGQPLAGYHCVDTIPMARDRDIARAGTRCPYLGSQLTFIVDLHLMPYIYASVHPCVCSSIRQLVARVLPFGIHTSICIHPIKRPVDGQSLLPPFFFSPRSPKNALSEHSRTCHCEWLNSSQIILLTLVRCRDRRSLRHNPSLPRVSSIQTQHKEAWVRMFRRGGNK